MFFVKPDFHYSYKDGFYADLSCSYFPSFNKSSVDNFAVGVGYDFDLGKNFSADLSYTYTKYFSNKEITSSAPNEFEGSLEWDNSIISPAINMAYSFGVTNDFATSVDFTHTFDFEHILTHSDKLSIPVEVSVAFASANFYQEYVKNNKVKRKAKKTTTKETNSKGKAETETTTTDDTTVDYTTINTNFAFSSITLSTGFTYSLAGFDFTPTLAYLFPFNQPADLESSHSLVFTFQITYSF